MNVNFNGDDAKFLKSKAGTYDSWPFKNGPTPVSFFTVAVAEEVERHQHAVQSQRTTRSVMRDTEEGI